MMIMLMMVVWKLLMMIMMVVLMMKLITARKKHDDNHEEGDDDHDQDDLKMMMMMMMMTKTMMMMMMMVRRRVRKRCMRARSEAMPEDAFRSEALTVYNGYYKVMSNIPKMGHLPTPEACKLNWDEPPRIDAFLKVATSFWGFNFPIQQTCFK